MGVVNRKYLIAKIIFAKTTFFAHSPKFCPSNFTRYTVHVRKNAHLNKSERNYAYFSTRVNISFQHSVEIAYRSFW